MKTLLASLVALTLSFTSAFAGGNKIQAGTINHHNMAVWENNTVIYAKAGAAGTQYHWVQEEGPAQASLIGTDTPSLIASSMMEVGYYVFALTTTAPNGEQQTDRVVVKVKNPNGSGAF